MNPANWISMLGGLALFLYGMKMMSEGLEAAAGNRLKGILEKLTSNRFLGVLVGAIITAAIQSSSATTVMVVGFVNSGLMKLTQAVWVIMGANIGTTITGQLIALDIGAFAPMIAFIGVALVVFFKRKKINRAGEIIAGLGILFIGMTMMSTSMAPLRDSPAFVSLLTNFQNPLLGILAGMVFTAIIQSSSASIGILQALAVSGVIGLDSAVFVLFGQNIGTCITAVIASIGTNKNAKRTTLIHLMFNIFGTVIFVTFTQLVPFTTFMANLTPNNVAQQIANVHTVFNVVTTLLLIPFGTLLTKLAVKILPGEDSQSGEKHLVYVGDHKVGSTAINIAQLTQEVSRMFQIAEENLTNAFKGLFGNVKLNMEKIEDNEEYLDYLNTEITRYISKISGADMPTKDSETINTLFKVTTNIERIGDHAINIAGYANILKNKSLGFSPTAVQEAETIQSIILQLLDQIDLTVPNDRNEALVVVSENEQRVDDLTEEFRTKQIQRMKNNTCNAEACVIFSELLTDMERISDHILNIAEEYQKAGLSLNASK